MSSILLVPLLQVREFRHPYKDQSAPDHPAYNTRDRPLPRRSGSYRIRLPRVACMDICASLKSCSLVPAALPARAIAERLCDRGRLHISTTTAQHHTVANNMNKSRA